MKFLKTKIFNKILKQAKVGIIALSIKIPEDVADNILEKYILQQYLIKGEK